jgi:hypothetical protein
MLEKSTCGNNILLVYMIMPTLTTTLEMLVMDMLPLALSKCN